MTSYSKIAVSGQSIRITISSNGYSPTQTHNEPVYCNLFPPTKTSVDICGGGQKQANIFKMKHIVIVCKGGSAEGKLHGH